MSNSTATSVELRTNAPIPECDIDLCTTGQAAACPGSSACKTTSGACAAPPLNRVPGVVCGGAVVGYCTAARDDTAVDAPCVCAAPYAGADCGECAPGFYSVAHAPWGPRGERCVQTPLDMREDAGSSTGAPTSGGGAPAGPPQPPASQPESKSALSGTLLFWVLGACAVVAVVAAVTFAVCRTARQPQTKSLSPLQHRTSGRKPRRAARSERLRPRPTERPEYFVREFALQRPRRGSDDRDGRESSDSSSSMSLC